MISPEMRRRLDNLKRHWESRYAAAADDAALAMVSFDRARAAARRAMRAGDDTAMHDLATTLATWAEQRELAEVRRHSA